jgi:hypothetical protein
MALARVCVRASRGFLLTLRVEPVVARRLYPEHYLASRLCFGNMDMAM